MNIEKAKAALKEYFGYEAFRPMQEEIIQSVYDQKDTVVLMPTGGGKSICYQIPAITMPGVCIVVSPLIALMKDQVEGLKSNGIRAAYLNSTLSSLEQQEIENEILSGRMDLVYISPEKAVSKSTLSFLGSAKVNFVAIDEAHCISQWGHDFRQEYTQLHYLRAQFPKAPFIALTATADKLTRKDISTQLQLRNPNVFLSSFDRPNLSLKVMPGRNRIEKILDFIQVRPNQSGIIYCLSRKSTESLSAKLNRQGIKAAYYHAGLSGRQRSEVQEEFINDNVPIICATVAFGMGIDKSNVRWVIHYNLPKNIEGYYQEIGRAGRDGAKSDTLLFYSYADVMTMRNILSDGESGNKDVQIAKLERMQQYAEALICRRSILLNYFSEQSDGNCGNCDICKNPPQHFDGTVVAQKALSAVYRMREKVGVNLLIDVLRGSRKQEVIQRNYHKIKTYGLGADYSANDWQQFVMQLLNKGLLEIAYDENNVLRLTDASQEVLFKGKKVELVRMTSIIERRHSKEEKKPKKSKKDIIRDELFERLRLLRKQIALDKGVPPYVVFSDVTLGEMSEQRPLSPADFLEISGVGRKKMQDYGKQFIKAIQEYVLEQQGHGQRIKGSTYLVTFEMLKQGHDPEEIAQKRNIHVTTVFSHLVYLFEKGEDIDLSIYISERELDQIREVWEETPDISYKDLYEQFDEGMPYHTIKIGLSLLKKENIV